MIRRLVPDWKQHLILVQPETVVRWHRQGWRLYWRWLTGTLIHPMPSAHPAVGRGPVRLGRYPHGRLTDHSGCGLPVRVRSDLDRRQVCGCRPRRRLRPVTERPSVHLRKYGAWRSYVVRVRRATLLSVAPSSAGSTFALSHPLLEPLTHPAAARRALLRPHRSNAER